MNEHQEVTVYQEPQSLIPPACPICRDWMYVSLLRRPMHVYNTSMDICVWHSVELIKFFKLHGIVSVPTSGL